MPEPVIQSATPPTVQPLGLSDPDFIKNLDAAFAQAKGAAPAPAPAPEPDPEPETTLEPPPPKEEAKPEKARTTGEQWKELRRLKDEAVKQAKEYEQKIKDYESRYRDFDPEKVKKIQSERDDLEARLKAFAIEHDPQFMAEVDQHMSRIKNEAESVLGDKASRFLSLLALPESDFKRQQLAALTDGMDEFTKLDALQVAREHRQIQSAKQERIANARQNWQKLMEAQSQQAEKQRAEHMRQFEDTLREWRDPQKGIAVMQYRDGDENWNGEVRQSEELARNILSGKMPPQEFIRASLWAASAPRLLNALRSSQQELSTLKAELESLRKAEPKIGGSGGESLPEEDTKGLSYGEVLAKMIERNGGFASR